MSARSCKDRITGHAEEFDSKLVFDCDVGDDAQIEALFADLRQELAAVRRFCPRDRFCAALREAIARRCSSTGCRREAFRMRTTSRPTVSRRWQGHAATCCTDTCLLSYLGAVRSVPNYNTMGLAKAWLEASVRYLASAVGPRGVRVNGVSAGPIKTLAASGIKGFGKMLEAVAQTAPLGRNVTIDDVGNVAAFLLSDLAAGVTSEITYVDGGFSHAMGGVTADSGSAEGKSE
ncbi:SDR family oxidoreductase [Piscinibacter sakaiensis]|uniref:SDR family oxidoreductase n=1 Tax=Piscinibacter sakaiensis TaxID=1547922 RepID=UPI003AB0D15C